MSVNNRDEQHVAIIRPRHWIVYSNIDVIATRPTEVVQVQWHRKTNEIDAFATPTFGHRVISEDYPEGGQREYHSEKTRELMAGNELQSAGGAFEFTDMEYYGRVETIEPSDLMGSSRSPTVYLRVQSGVDSTGELDRFLQMTTEWKLPEGTSITVPVALECFSRKDLKHKKDVGKGNQANLSLYTTQFRGDVMLKEYRPAHASDMMKEIVLLQKVNSHQYIVRVLGLLFETDEDLKKGRYPRGFLMEPLACSLTHVLRDRNFEITVQQIMKWVLQISSAVVFLHKLHIYHADLKPDNLLLTDDNVMKLADFGISSMKEYPCSVGFCTQNYAAPELFDQGELGVPADEKTDVYSLGVCIWQMVHRRIPPTRHVGKEYEYRLDFDDDINCEPFLKEFTLRCLSLTNTDRPSMEEVHILFKEQLDS